MKNSAQITNFLLAGRKLKSHLIVSLLLSSSFGLNAIFYAAWLGYTIGVWALLIQAAWSISFFLLMPASQQFSKVTSLHDFLGQQFGYTTKVLAALCSVVGILLFVAWEVSINMSTITPLLHTNQNFSASMFIGFFALVSILYTCYFGLRGNAVIDAGINFIKLVILMSLGGIALYYFTQLPKEILYSSMFPSWSTVVANFGILGFVTNIIFNLAWQFVDNSSWQSIIGGSERSDTITSHNLKYSGIVIFLTVNLISTLLGVSLAHIHIITPDNILFSIALLVPQYNTFISVSIIILSIGSLMSVVDGMLLSLALTLNTDLLSDRILIAFDSKKRMILIQASIILFGLVGIWGIGLLLKVLHSNVFDFLYIIVISQLSLIGPILFGLYTKHNKNEQMWIPILGSLIIGFVSVFTGGIMGNKMLIDGAGTYVVVVSILGAWIVQKIARNR